jgi:hypothetical protein
LEKASPREGPHMLLGGSSLWFWKTLSEEEEGGVLAAMITNRVSDDQQQEFLAIDDLFFRMKIRTRQESTKKTF